MLETIRILKDTGILGEGSKTSEVDVVSKIIEIFVRLGLIGKDPPPPPDIFSEIKKLRELGIIKFSGEEKPEDPLESVNKLRSLIEVITPLVGGESKTSLGVEMVRIIGPHVPEIVKDITGSVNKVAEVSKAKLSSKLGEIPSREVKKEVERSISPQIPKDFSPYEKEEVSLPSQVLEEKKLKERSDNSFVMVNPVIEQTNSAILRRDRGFFPKFAEILIMYVGPHIIDSLLDGTVSINTFRQGVAHLSPLFLEPQAEEYLKDFLEWYKEEVSKEISDIVEAECVNCKEKYDFSSKEDFGLDDRVCEVCGGEITLMAPVGSEQNKDFEKGGEA